MVSVLATGPKVCGSKPGQGNGFLRAIKICSTPSFTGEVKPEAPCCKILGRVKYRKYKQKHFIRPNSLFPSPIPPACYQMTAGRIARALVGESRVFFVDTIPLWLSMVIHHLGDGGCSSETQSHLINVIIRRRRL
jgi:hypothetical protein